MGVLLSAGHDLNAKGACNGAVCEFDLTPDWVDRIYDILQGVVPVAKVPHGTLAQKVAFINQYRGAKLVVEIHFNSNIPNAKGSETLYNPQSQKGKEFAVMVQQQFKARNIFQPDRGVKEGWYQQDPKKGPLYFLDATKPVASIIEPQFMSQLTDIINNKYEGCDAIAQAIIQYYEKYGEK